MKTQNTTFEFVPENFDEFRRILTDLTRLNDIVKLSITNDYILMYSIVGSSQVVLAMKSHQLDTIDYIKLTEELENPLDCIIMNAKKFVKNIGFVKVSDKIKCKLSYKVFDDDTTEVRSFQLTNGKLKLSVETSNRGEIKNITKEQFNNILDVDKSEWDFNINASDFNDISKLAKINSEESRRILNITADNGKVNLSEDGLWDIEVDETDQPDAHIMVNKNYLPYIDGNGSDIVFNVFSNFILTESGNSKLMISFEQTFD
jgi:hypothetical protein